MTLTSRASLAIVEHGEAVVLVRRLEGQLQRERCQVGLKSAILAHAFPWEYRCKRLELTQLLGQLGVCLTCWAGVSSSATQDGCSNWNVPPWKLTCFGQYLAVGP
jgi:hypothetical protein